MARRERPRAGPGGGHAWPASTRDGATELCALDHDGPFQLLVATILSAQCTDERVNMVTPALFAAYPTPAAWPGPTPASSKS